MNSMSYSVAWLLYMSSPSFCDNYNLYACMLPTFNIILMFFVETVSQSSPTITFKNCWATQLQPMYFFEYALMGAVDLHSERQQIRDACSIFSNIMSSDNSIRMEAKGTLEVF